MKRTLLAAAAACLLLTAGCVYIADNTVEPEKFKDGHRAGGGLEISYVAPEDGVINLVDKRTGRHLMSKSVIEGEVYEFSARDLDPAEEKKWGVDVKKADFVLYFYPNPKPPIAPAPADPLSQAPNAPLPPPPPLPPHPQAPAPQPQP